MTVPRGKPRFNEAQFRDVLSKQLGLITTDQLRDIGLSDSAASKRAARGELVRVLPRVYRSTLFAPSLREGALGAVLWAGDGAVASHLTAARIFGAELPASKPHIWVPTGRGLRSNLVVVHRGVIDSNDRRIRDRVPITSPSRILVDIAGMVDDETLEAVTEDFLHRGITTPLAIGRSLDRAGSTGRPGSHRLRALLANRDQAPLQKRLEVRLWRLMRQAGLRPTRQHEVRVGNKKYFLDFAFVALRVGIEGHGFGAHGGRVAHKHDANRLADLVSVGWRIVPVTWEAITEDPDGVIEQVRNALLEAAA